MVIVDYEAIAQGLLGNKSATVMVDDGEANAVRNTSASDASGAGHDGINSTSLADSTSSIGSTAPIRPLSHGISPIMMSRLHLELANIYLNLLLMKEVVPAAKLGSPPDEALQGHTLLKGPCLVVPDLDPATPWLAPSCSVFPYTGHENNFTRLVDIQVGSGRG